MLDLQPIKDDLEAATSWSSHSGDNGELHRKAAEYISALVAEVERLRAELESEVVRLRDDNHALKAEVILTLSDAEELRSAIKTHREELLRGGPACGLDVTPFDRKLWSALDAS